MKENRGDEGDLWDIGDERNRGDEGGQMGHRR